MRARGRDGARGGAIEHVAARAARRGGIRDFRRAREVRRNASARFARAFDDSLQGRERGESARTRVAVSSLHDWRHGTAQRRRRPRSRGWNHGRRRAEVDVFHHRRHSRG